jgi:methylmalonyl-CoA/ethylmalonyl-CoA epimerase
MGSIALTWEPSAGFHHVGFVVGSIEHAAEAFARSIGAEWDGVIVHDPNQTVRVSFFCSKEAGDPLFELIEPVGDGSPVLALAKRGGGLHHVCYLVDSMERKLEESRAQRSLILRPPIPAVAFGGRRIAWIYTRQKLLIEYLER